MYPTGSEVQEEIISEFQLSPSESVLFSAKSIRFSLLASSIYLVLSIILLGFKVEQLILILFFNTFYFASKTTRKFILGFSIFIIYWIIFDYMKAFPNYHFNAVHIHSLYSYEKDLFGINIHGLFLTPNEYFAANHNAALDILSGIFYLCWVPVPLIFASILFFRNKSLFLEFSLSFFLVNMIGFAIYYIYPAAPPWYIAQKGFHFIASTPGNTAGLGRFDAYFGTNIFAGIYSKSSNVFAAMPSLHAAYMLIVLYYGIKGSMKWFNLVFAFIMFGIWFSAIYSGHHYILDVLAGILCAVFGIMLFQWFIHTAKGQKLMNALLAPIR
ncbi:MAG TPA: phosphatase PAP2 family protein [Flavisolibacter sp.]|nr:phosphatase PAP2 family protein [Flavisolibacter sp.]